MSSKPSILLVTEWLKRKHFLSLVTRWAVGCVVSNRSTRATDIIWPHSFQSWMVTELSLKNHFLEARSEKGLNWPHYEAKNKTFRQTLKNSTIRRILMRGFQIWSQNSNRKRFNRFFCQKLKILRILGKSGKSLDFTVFWPKSGLNIFRFEFWDQIWNPIIKIRLIVLFLYV